MKQEKCDMEKVEQLAKELEKNICRFKDIWKGKKILVADDEKTCIYLIKQILKKTKIEIIYALNGKEAIELCQKHKDIALALIDYKMPVMNGEQTVEQIKNIYNNLPVVVHTHDYQYKVRQKCLKAGCNDIIYKPLKKMELLEKIEKWIN